MPANTPSNAEPAGTNLQPPASDYISGELFHAWTEEFARRKREWTDISDVDLGFDPEKWFFNAVTFRTILFTAAVRHLVLFFGCRSKQEAHKELTIYACGVDTNCQIITNIYKGRTVVEGDPAVEDTSVEFDELKRGQINWISRNLYLEAAGKIDPYNEFNGYAHSPDFFINSFFEFNNPNPKYPKSALYFGVDTRREPRNVIAFIGVFGDNQEDLPNNAISESLKAADNGSQCCPIPDGITL